VLASGPIAAKLAAGLAVAIALQLLLLYRSQNIFNLPGVMLTAIVLMHLALLLNGSSLVEAQADGWTFQPQRAAALKSPWQFAELRSFPWTTLPWLAGDLLAVMFVTPSAC
jgi:sulfate permease, SulP family